MEAIKLTIGYKQTEIGLIPEEWEVVRLGDVLQKEKSTVNPQNYLDEIFELYSIPAYHTDMKPELTKGKDIRSQKLLIKNNTVLFGKINPRVPKIWFVSSNGTYRKIASTEFIPLVSNPRSEPRFIYYLAWSHYLLKKSKSLTSGSTPSRKRVDIKAFLELPIPLSPLPEQQKIAKVLSTVQRAIEQQDKIIETTRKLKKSLMHTLFTEGLNGEEQKETEIGLIPKSWEVVRLGDAAEIKTSTSSLTSLKNYITSQSISSDTVKILYLKVADLNLPINAPYIVESNEMIQARKGAINHFNVVPPFSIIFPKRGGALVRIKRESQNFIL